jgi:hypothetical protein
MTVEQKPTFRTSRDGVQPTAILRFKVGEVETEAKERLSGEPYFWDVTQVPYHVTEDNVGKVFHAGSIDGCKYCRRSGVNAKTQESEEPVVAKVTKRKPGRPKGSKNKVKTNGK